MTAIESLVKEIVEAHGFELVDLEFDGMSVADEAAVSGRRRGAKKMKKKVSINVFIYRPEGVSIADCRKISRAISDTFDTEEAGLASATSPLGSEDHITKCKSNIDLPSSMYYLVVSSPGLDRPLKTRRDYERNIGETVKLTLLSGERVTGELMSIREDDDDSTLVISPISKNGNPIKKQKDSQEELEDISLLDIKKGTIEIMP